MAEPKIPIPFSGEELKTLQVLTRRVNLLEVHTSKLFGVMKELNDEIENLHKEVMAHVKESDNDSNG